MRSTLGLLSLAVLGGAVGTLVRVFLGLVVPPLHLSSTGIDGDLTAPVTAMTVCNLTGAALLGFVSAATEHHPCRDGLRALLGTGFCGGFTTLSAVSLLIVSAEGPPFGLRLAVLVVNVAAGLACVWAGSQAGAQLNARHALSGTGDARVNRATAGKSADEA